MTSLRAGADTSHESAEDMWWSLGWHVDWDSADDCGQVAHPVCTVEQLDTLTDPEILRAVARERRRDERGAYESAIAYAREALNDMRSLAALLIAAVESYQAGDLDDCIVCLDAASSHESDYGDDPASRALRHRLIEE